MKIEVGKVYRHKITKKKVIVDRIENRKVYFANRGTIGSGVTSTRDFALKYEQI